MKDKKKKATLKDLKIIFKYIKKHRFGLIISTLFIFLSNTSYILTGYLNGVAIEAVSNSNLKGALIALGLYFLMEMITGPVCRIFYYILGKIQTTVSNEISYDTYRKSMQLPSYAFEELSSGEIINRVTNDTETIVSNLDQLIQIISRFVSTLIILVYIFINSWIIGTEIILFLFIYSFVVKHFSKKLKENRKKIKEEHDKYTSISNESIRGIREIKTLGIVNNLYDNVKVIINNLLKANINEMEVSTKYDMFTQVLSSALEVGTFMTCAYLVYKGDISVTFFIAMTYYIYRYMYLIDNITSFSKNYERLMVSLERVNELLNNKLYEDISYGDKSLEEVKGVIEFKDVTFNYKNDPILLDNFNIKFEPNKKIAIIGSSGEGKSTIFNLITRIFDPVKGSVLLDGVDIRDLTEESLRKNISIIRQEPFLFNKTILENFKLLNSNIDLDTVRKYCKIACIDDYIMSLPNKYDTLLGEGGVNLSGGQKQRLSIARTLVKESKVILFDEATSALDNESQEYIKKSIDKLAKDHTVLIVAHRLSTIIDADVIYIVKKGKVYASGTHEYLMKNNKFYQKLYTTEAKTI